MSLGPPQDMYSPQLGKPYYGSKKQDGITLSTVEAEYVAGTITPQEAIWLRSRNGNGVGSG